MRKETKTKMPLGEFIEKMKAGWGFYRPYQVIRAGQRLAQLFTTDEILNKEVNVTFISASYGKEHYYDWKVEGVGLPTGKTEILSPGTPDILFGSSIDRLLTLIHLDEHSFSVYFTN